MTVDESRRERTEAIALVRRMAGPWDDDAIAMQLNLLGWRTGNRQLLDADARARAAQSARPARL